MRPSSRGSGYVTRSENVTICEVTISLLTAKGVFVMAIEIPTALRMPRLALRTRIGTTNQW